MIRQVVIVNNAHEFESLRKKFGDSFYVASDYDTYEILRDDGVVYLYEESTNSEHELSSIYKSSLNWHRDTNGNCLILNNGVTYGPVIARSVISSFANDYRNYLAIKVLLENFDIVCINNNSISSFHRTSVVFGEKIKWYETNSETDSLSTSSPLRTVIENYPVIHPLSKFARLAQKVLLPFLKKKTIIWPDWSYSSLFKSHNESLYLNSFNVWRGCYLCESTKYLDEANEIFPNDILESVINFERIKKKLIELDIDWDDRLIQLFIATIKRIYRGCYLKLRRSFSIYKEFFCYYQPESIVFPGETHFAYLIATQLAKNLKITTILALDGYPFVKDESSYFYMGKKGDYSFDKYVAYGLAHKQLMQNIEHLPEEKIIISQSPLVNLVKQSSTVEKTNYVLVLAYTPKQHNPQTRWDKRIKIALDIVHCLIDSDENSVLVKVKSGAGSELERSYYEDYFEKCDLSNKVSIVTGELNEYVASAKFIVGQLSTSLFESILGDTPYHIYEPYEAGLPASSIESLIFIKSETVNRNLVDLRFSINNSLFFKFNNYSYNYIVEGPSLKNIQFQKKI